MPVPSLTSFGRTGRGKSNLGGLAAIYIIGASQFTAQWPTEANITAGEVTVVPPLAEDVIPALLTFDIGSGKSKTSKKGTLGYQCYEHSIEAAMAGIESTQAAALLKTLNEGFVALAKHKNGEIQVLGTSTVPLEATDESDSGDKGDSKRFISFKGTGADFYGWGAVFVGSGVTLALPTGVDTQGEPAWT